MGVIVILVAIVIAGVHDATWERPVPAEEAEPGRATDHEDLGIVLGAAGHQDGGGDSSPFHRARSLLSAAMRRAAARRSARLSPGDGAILRKVLLVLAGTLVILETVPRWVSIPGLTTAELKPPYLESTADRAFEPHPYMLYSPKPDYGRAADPDRPLARRFHHGPLGFRAPEVARSRRVGTRRIACVGGSSTYGTGPSSDEATWPAQLGARLAEGPGGAAEVLNAGVPAWTSFECLTSLAFRVLPMKPDLVLFYLATNDAERLRPDPRTTSTTARSADFRPRPWSQRSNGASSVGVAPLRDGLPGQRPTSVGPSAPLAQTASDSQYRHPSGGPLPDQGFENFRRNRPVVALTRAHGARPTLLTQAIWSEDPTSDSLLTASAAGRTAA